MAKRRARSAPRLSREQLEKLEQRQLDVVGLSLIAIGAYFAFVLWMGWDGGRVGSGVEEGLTYVFGKVAYVAPLVMFGAGAILIAKPFLPAIRPLRTGGICIVAGLLLAFAAQTAHLGPDELRGEYFDPSWFPQHGGLVGEGLYWSTSTLFQRIGAHIVAALLIVAGALLLTGMSIATFMSGTGKAITRARSTGAEMARTVAQTSWNREEAAADAPTQVAATDVMSEYPDEDMEPTVRVVEFDQDPDPEPEVPESEAPTGELEALTLDGEDSEDEAEVVEAEPGAEPQSPDPREVAAEAARTPMGEKRGATISDEIAYKAPPDKLLEKGKADKGPDPRDQEAVGDEADRDPGPLRRRGQDRRHRQRPARLPL